MRGSCLHFLGEFHPGVCCQHHFQCVDDPISMNEIQLDWKFVSGGMGTDFVLPSPGGCLRPWSLCHPSFCPTLLPLADFATGQRRLFLGLFLGGGQNIKNHGVFAAARLDVGPFFFYLFFIFSLLF